MPQQQLLEKVVHVLEDNQIDYMITGSTVSSLQGEPRATHDIDIVVVIKQSAVASLIKAFPLPQYYLSEDAARDAITRKGMFNLLDTTEGDKVDFWLLTDDAFDTSRFARKYEEDAFGFKMKVSAAEDTILSKLRWAKLSGGSEKQFNDALRVYELQYALLDKGYLEIWARKLNVQDLYERIKQEAHPVS
jgi:hypothetical protein